MTPKQQNIGIAIFGVLFLIMIGVVFVTLIHEPLPTKKSNTQIQTPTTSSTESMTVNEKNCGLLLEAINTYNWKSPTLVSSTLAQYAVPSLVQALLKEPHMTVGEIAQKWSITPDVGILSSTSSTVTALVIVPFPHLAQPATYGMKCTMSHDLVEKVQVVYGK